MFPYPIATPQGCNIQTFYGVGLELNSEITFMSWNKPVGVSHVYMMLIGAGGKSADANGGGSGAVTVWYGAAQHVPDNLLIEPSPTQSDNTIVRYRNRNATPTLLQAGSANGSIAGTATTAPAFAASGFYKSTAGQAGAASNTASTTTFLSGGGSSVVGNYGYSTNSAGFFQMQPIIVGLAGAGSNVGGIGCGGGGTSIPGGPGMVLIASW
jgi:hypothetical protein